MQNTPYTEDLATPDGAATTEQAISTPFPVGVPCQSDRDSQNNNDNIASYAQ
jgi:hypothetical protein